MKVAELRALLAQFPDDIEVKTRDDMSVTGYSSPGRVAMIIVDEDSFIYRELGNCVVIE